MAQIKESHAAKPTFIQGQTPAMDDYSYSRQSDRLHSQAQDLAPYSAVSSFNLPAACNSSLLTPVSVNGGQSSSMITHLRNDRDKISPYPYYIDDEDSGGDYSRPMKLKNPNSTLQYQHSESHFEFPNTPPEPYYGQYLASTTSSRNMNSSPRFEPSSEIRSAQGYSSCNYRQFYDTPPPSATSAPCSMGNEAPILSAPDPLSLRPRVKREESPFGKVHSEPSSHSAIQPQDSFHPGEYQHTPSNGKKRKSPEISTESSLPQLPSHISPEERVLLELIMREDLQWKDRCVMFEERTKTPVKEAALQMRRNRLLTRLMEQAMAANFPDWDEARFDALTMRCDKANCDKNKWTNEKNRWRREHAIEGSVRSPSNPSPPPPRRQPFTRKPSQSGRRRRRSNYFPEDIQDTHSLSTHTMGYQGQAIRSDSGHRQFSQNLQPQTYSHQSVTQQGPPFDGLNWRDSSMSRTNHSMFEPKSHYPREQAW